MSSFDNCPLLSGQNTHGGGGGVVLFWKHAFDDDITPLTIIHSDRIVGIKCDFDNSSPLFIYPLAAKKTLIFLNILTTCGHFMTPYLSKVT